MCAKLTSPGPPRSRTPSLNALRAFEAMGRAGGATAAAAELGVTHGAVSRQVKALEHSLGLALFTGPRHRLRLTPAGQQLLGPLGQALDQIAAAVAGLQGDTAPLRLAVHPSLSVKWLIPRLAGLAEAHPGIALELTELVGAARGQRGAQAVVRILSRPDQAAVASHRLMPNAIGPVLSPALLARHGGDALAAPRLISASHAQGWSEWAGHAGLAIAPLPERPFAHLHFAFDAAIAGLGAMISPWPMVADDIAAGRLAAPLGFVSTDSDVVLIPAPGEMSRPLRAVLRWLQGEGAKMPLPPSSRP
jgi:LysR family glycine cleavage system transcriptional activator